MTAGSTISSAQDDSLRGQASLPGNAQIAPAVSVAFGVGALDVQDRDVGLNRRDVQQAGLSQAHPRVALRQVGPEQRAGRQIRHTHRRGEQSKADREIRVLFQLEPARRNLVFDRAPVVVAEAGADVADPGCGDSPHAAGPDELIEQDVRDGSDQLQVTTLLADQLVRGGERDQRLERRAQSNRCPVRYEAIYGLAQRQKLHRRPDGTGPGKAPSSPGHWYA